MVVKNQNGSNFYCFCSRNSLEKLIQDIFKKYNNEKDPILKDCKTNVCIPVLIYWKVNLQSLKIIIIVNLLEIITYQHIKQLWQPQQHQHSFDPYSSDYLTEDGKSNHLKSKVDGGVFANNPTLIGIVEAKRFLSKKVI